MKINVHKVSKVVWIRVYRVAFSNLIKSKTLFMVKVVFGEVAFTLAFTNWKS